jgi:hypothetical protein
VAAPAVAAPAAPARRSCRFARSAKRWSDSVNNPAG